MHENPTTNHLNPSWPCSAFIRQAVCFAGVVFHSEARGRQSAGSATTAFDKARVSTDKAANEMLSQTELRRRSKKREFDLAVQTAATASATSTVTSLENAAAQASADYLALNLELQALKRQ